MRLEPMYRTIDARFWTDPKVRKMTPPGKLLFLYLVTNSHTHVSGIYHLPGPVIIHEIGLKKLELDTLCHTLSTLGILRIDQENEIFWVVNMMGYQGNGEKNCRSAAFHLNDLHNSFLIPEFLEKYPAVKPFVKIPYRYPIQEKDDHATTEQEQEQEQEQDNNTREKQKPFQVPTIKEIQDHCQQRGNKVDPESFMAYYEARGWMLGKAKMKSWQAAIITWEKNGYSANGNGEKFVPMGERLKQARQARGEE